MSDERRNESIAAGLPRGSFADGILRRHGIAAPSGDAPPIVPRRLPPRLVLIGTGHVFQIQQTIRDAIQAIRPDVVFVELDQGRLNALLHRRRTGEMPQGRGGFVQSRLQRFQESVAGSYGADVGGEMVAAVEGAGDVGARVGLIDLPAEQTVKRALKALTLREKMRAVGQIIGAGFKRILPGKRGNIESEIQRYQEDPKGALEELRRQYPSVHRVVIDERDEHMSRRIRAAMSGGGIGVAVVGDGHVGGMLQRLEGLGWELEVYRLPAVRDGLLPKPETVDVPNDGGDVSYGFNVDL